MIKKILMSALGAFCLFIHASYIHAAEADLVWNTPVDGGPVEGYTVYWSTASGSYSDADSMNVVGETSATVTGLDESEDHYFIVKAYNSGGFGPASNEVLMEANSDFFHDEVSDEAGGGGGGGCFIATAAYGSMLEPHVVILREFRDRVLLKNAIGKAFVDLYYTYSPPIAKIIADRSALRFTVRWGLLPIVGLSYATLSLGPINTFFTVLLLASGVVGLLMKGLASERKRAHREATI
jgi:hypothetical protein